MTWYGIDFLESTSTVTAWKDSSYYSTMLYN